MNTKVKAALASYARSVLAAAAALYLAGFTDPVELANALLAGLLPVTLRYLNPKDPAFGIVSKAVPGLAMLSRGDAVIPKKYIEQNKAAFDKLIKEATKATSSNAGGKPIKAELVKGKPAAKKASPKKPTAK